jgi:brefeldin A-resistance guanine nucleotide exchange factor 1
VVIDVSDGDTQLDPADYEKTGSLTPEYDPSIAFILEFCTILSCRDSESVMAHAKPVADSLQNVLRGAKKFHPIIISRAMFYTLKLLQSSYVCSSLGHTLFALY